MNTRMMIAVAGITGLLLLSACASDPAAEATVTVTFGGDACTYAGEAIFDAGTELTIKVINGSGTSFGFSVWKVPDGTTVEDIQTRGMPTVGGDDENMRGILRPGSVDRELIVALDTSGTWGMDCFVLNDFPVGDSDGYAAAVVEVR